MKKLGWGILGTGFISGVVARAINELEGNFVVAVGGRDVAKTEKFAFDHQIKKAYGDYLSVVNNPDVDIVYIALPNHLHAEWIINSAKAGKAVLCEKPFTLNAKACEQVADFLSKNKVFCMEALMYRFHPLTQKLVELIQSKVIGDICAFDALYADNIHQFANSTAGGGIMDIGSYPLSLIRMLAGVTSLDDIDISGIGHINKQNNNDNFAGLHMKFDNGAVASIVTSNCFGMNSHFRVIGSKGVIETKNPWLPQEKEIISVYLFDQKTPEVIEVRADYSTYHHEIAEVSECVRNGKLQSSRMTLEDSLLNMTLLDAWRASINLKYAVE